MEQESTAVVKPVVGLFAIHTVAGILGALASADQPAVSSSMFLALVFCQASLIGMWGGFGNSHWALRQVGVVVGMLVLWATLGLGIGELNAHVFLLVFIAAGIVAVVTLIARTLKAELVRGGEDSVGRAEGLQFTIRHLLLLTLVVGCVLAVGRLLAPHLHGVERSAAITVLGLCFGAVALTSIWAMLGSGRPALRMIPVICLAAGSGWVGAYAIDRSEYPFWISTMVLEAMFLGASLRVLRSDGYRLAAK